MKVFMRSLPTAQNLNKDLFSSLEMVLSEGINKPVYGQSSGNDFSFFLKTTFGKVWKKILSNLNLA